MSSNDERLTHHGRADSDAGSDVELERDTDEQSRALHSQQPGEALSDAVSKGLGLADEEASASSLPIAALPSMTQRTNAQSILAQLQPREASPAPQPSHGRRASSGDSSSSSVVDDERVCWNRVRLPFWNVLLMSLAFMLLFSAFNTVQGFCTSLLPDGLGNISLTVCYATVVCVVIFAPAIVNFLGEPVAMLLGAGCYCIYMASLIASDRTLLLGCSVILGFGGSILWVASGSYLTRCSADHERSRNTGIFWSLFQMSAVIGNLSAYAIFQHVSSTQLFTVLCVVGCFGAAMLLALKPLPERFYPKDNSIYASGASGGVGAGLGRRNSTSYFSASVPEVSINVSASAHPSSDAQDEAESDGLRNRESPSGVPTAILPLPLTASVHPLVVPLPVVLVPGASSTAPVVALAVNPSVSSLVRDVLSMFGDARLLMLMPMMVFLGLELSYWTGEFPQLLPRESIGLVLCCAGVMEVVGGVGLGWVSDRWGRSVTLVLGSFVFSIGLYLSSTYLMFHNSVAPAWQDVKGVAYVSAACFGLGDAAFNTQVYSLVSSEFSRSGESKITSAFAVFNFTVNVGMAVGFFYGLALPMHSAKGTRTQVAVLVVVLAVASTLFVVCERRCELQRRRNKAAAKSRRNSSAPDLSAAHSVQCPPDSAEPLSIMSASAAPSAVNRLYRHALESIFRFCSLKELHAVLAVNREWSSAVDSMPPIRARCRADSIERLALISRSRLSRHLIEAWGESTSSLNGLRLLADRLPWIEQYEFTWSSEHDECDAAALALSQLRRLRSLSIDLGSMQSMEQHASAINSLLHAAGCMPDLEHLTLRLLGHDHQIDFAPLAALTRLHVLAIFASSPPSALPSDELVAALRQLQSLEAFHHDFSDRNGVLRLLLQPPTPPLCWTSTGVASGAPDLLPLLHLLPNLIKIDVECGCGDVEFLLSLPRVTTLALYPYDRFVGPADLTRIVCTLKGCPQLTSLSLHRLGLTTSHLVALLPALPHLSRLKIGWLLELTSLSFLATEALAASLTSLHVVGCCKMPSDELAHLIGLRSLRELSLTGCREPLSATQKAQLRAVHSHVQL